MMGGKTFLAVSAALLLGLALLAACGGGDEQPKTLSPGRLTDPRSVPTATPWQVPPEVIILPDALTSLGEGGEVEEEEGGEEGEELAPGECSATYTVVPGDYPSLIAEKCGVDLQDLLDANPGIEPTKLQVGEVLNIPQ